MSGGGVRLGCGGLFVGALVIAFAVPRAAYAESSSFDRWLRNPYPVATGFSFPVGTNADPSGREPVMAIATGKVVVSRRSAAPDGLVVVLEHIVLEGHEKRRLRSHYAHLSRIDVREGQIVQGRDRIGAVDRARDGLNPLRLEIRSDKGDLDPSTFIRAHGKLPDPAAEPQLVLVDQARFRMQVRIGGRVAREVEIGLGQSAGQKRREGDLRTPKGIYFVVDKQKGSFGGDWGEYFGGYWIKVNYPGPADAAWGVENGIVDEATAAAIGAAWSERKLTPQNTPLGSGIGFHGWASDWKSDGKRGARLSFGCVVLHNRDMASWFDEVPLGTMVVIF